MGNKGSKDKGALGAAFGNKSGIPPPQQQLAQQQQLQQQQQQNPQQQQQPQNIFTKMDASLTPDDFHLLKLIGKGSFGKVFQVQKSTSLHLSLLL